MPLTSTNVEPNLEATVDTATATAGGLLVRLSPLSPQALETTLTNLALAFPAQGGSRSVMVATPDAGHPAAAGSSFGRLKLLPYTPATPLTPALFLTAADYLDTFRLAQQNNAGACLLLGPESQSLGPEAVRVLSAEVLSASPADLAVPCYSLGHNEGLVNSAILYPVTRALYGSRTRFPLAIDLGLSLRMAERLATVAQRFTSMGQGNAILWPVAEAAAANWTVTEIDAGPRGLPQPPSIDLNALLAEIAGSFFADIDAKASFWQRARAIQPLRNTLQAGAPVEAWPDVTPMLEAFRLAYVNLQEIWALVLPPNSLLALKHLSMMAPTAFRMSDALWTRIVYDFVLAYRMRTINRSHLLGALTPLYLAWVASHIILIGAGTTPEEHIEAQAATFAGDKAYLVSRWRWPDRFNP